MLWTPSLGVLSAIACLQQLLRSMWPWTKMIAATLGTQLLLDDRLNITPLQTRNFFGTEGFNEVGRNPHPK